MATTPAPTHLHGKSAELRLYGARLIHNGSQARVFVEYDFTDEVSIGENRLSQVQVCQVTHLQEEGVLSVVGMMDCQTSYLLEGGGNLGYVRRENLRQDLQGRVVGITEGRGGVRGCNVRTHQQELQMEQVECTKYGIE